VDNEKDTGRELAQWLQEAGKRVRSTSAPIQQPATEQPRRAGASWDARFAAIKRMTLLTLLAGSYLLYYFVDVMLQISLLPALIVFVPAAGVA
jgi:Flp pilus assembly protein TadB